MIYTSYFRKPGLPLERAVAISFTVPPGWQGRRYLPLAPTRRLLDSYKSGRWSWGAYAVEYQVQVLGELDPMEVRSDLTQHGDVILCCYERDPARCHRSLVADWLSFIEPVTEWESSSVIAGQRG